MSTATLPEITTAGDLGDEIAAFLRSMRREHASPNTILTYATACRLFAEWLAAHGHPTDVDAITKRHVEEWEIDLGEHAAPATVHNRHRGLQRFFSWYLAVTIEDDPQSTYRSPMALMKPPRLPQYQPRVLTMDELRAIVGACSGRTFEDRRDEALVRLFFSTGARRAEVSGLTVDDYSPAADTLRVVGKGDKDRRIFLADNTRDALEAYRRARKKHAHADLPWLWLGSRGRLTDSGIAQAIRHRGQLAGIAELHPHDFRHAWRHHLEMGGASRETLMSLGGWSSDAMLRRYASTSANDRAIDHARKIGFGDEL